MAVALGTRLGCPTSTPTVQVNTLFYDNRQLPSTLGRGASCISTKACMVRMAPQPPLSSSMRPPPAVVSMYRCFNSERTAFDVDALSQGPRRLPGHPLVLLNAHQREAAGAVTGAVLRYKRHFVSEHRRFFPHSIHPSPTPSPPSSSSQPAAGACLPQPRIFFPVPGG